MTNDEKQQMVRARQEWQRARLVQSQQRDCPHAEHDGGICLECHKDIWDDLVSRAEAAADAREDR